MKILTAAQIYLADKATILQKGITSLALMEQAAFQCFDFLQKNDLINHKSVKIFCGIGNNGGDGLVIARFLKEIKVDVSCYIVHFSDNQSDDFKTNLERLQKLNVQIHAIYNENDFPKIQTNEIIIDAIFGIGLKKSPVGFTKKLIQHINNSAAYIISIDMPSGLFADKSIDDKESVIKSHKILTFQVPKLAFLLPDNQEFCADFEVLDIGLNQDFINNLETNYFFTTEIEVQKLYQPRNKFAHKGNFGHALLIGGSYGKMGAITLTSKATLKIGCGLVTAYIPKSGYEILQTAIPEVMVEVDNETEIHHFNHNTITKVIGVGPGLGLHEKTIEGFLNFLKLQKNPLVIDADALNILAQNKSYLKYIPKNTVLTPHPKEFERLVGTWKNDFEKLEKLQEFSNQYKVVIVLKGAFTVIAFQNQLHFNASGNPALATAGSGDVLTGIITGLIAQGYNSFDAAKIGVFIHGKTADIYTQQFPQETLIASEIIDLLPIAIIQTFYQ